MWEAFWEHPREEVSGNPGLVAPALLPPSPVRPLVAALCVSPQAAMVHAFLLHTLSPRPGDAAGPCRLLYSRVFGSERPDAAPEPPGLQELERERLGQKERMLVVAR